MKKALISGKVNELRDGDLQMDYYERMKEKAIQRAHERFEIKGQTDLSIYRRIELRRNGSSTGIQRRMWCSMMPQHALSCNQQYIQREMDSRVNNDS